MTRAKRMRLQDHWTNKVHWPINTHDQLEPCPSLEKITEGSSLTEEALENFRTRVNDLILTTLMKTAPAHLRYGGFLVAVLVMIIGVVCLSQEEYAVGTVVVLIGFCFVVGGFWYRGRLIHRGWKKIGQGLSKEFKKMGDKYAGISYEFHVQGHHKLNKIGNERKRKKKKKKDKGHHADTGDARQQFFERYIIIYLPGDASHFHDFVEDKRSVAAILKGDSAAVHERQDIVGGDPLVLPYWWSIGKTEDGRTYYINNLKHKTQWQPPMQAQVEQEKAELNEILAPPVDSDEESTSDSH